MVKSLPTTYLGFAILLIATGSSCLEISHDYMAEEDPLFLRIPLSSKEDVAAVFDLVGMPKGKVLNVFKDQMECGYKGGDSCSIVAVVNYDGCVYGCGFARSPQVEIAASFLFDDEILDQVSAPVENAYVLNSFLLNFDWQGGDIEVYEKRLYEKDVFAWGRWYLPNEKIHFEMVQEPSNSHNTFLAISLQEIDLARTARMFDSCEKELCMIQKVGWDDGYCAERCSTQRISEDFIWGVTDDVCKDIW